MLRLLLSALIALLLAVAVAVAGYALWLGAAAAPGPRLFAEPLVELPRPELPRAPRRPTMPPAATEATPAPAAIDDGIRCVVPLRRIEFSVANPGGRLFVFDGARGVPIAQLDVPPSGNVSADLPPGAHEVLIADRPDRARTSYRTRAAIDVPAEGRPASAPIQLDARVQGVTVTIQLPPKTPLGVETAQRGGIDLANLRRDDDPDWHLAPDVTTDVAAAEVQLRFANLGPGQYTLELPPCLHFASGTRPATWTVPGPAAHTLDFRTP